MEPKKSIISRTRPANDTQSSDYNRKGNQIEEGKLSYEWALKSMKIITRIMKKESVKKTVCKQQESI